MILTATQVAACFMFLCSLLLVGVIYSSVHWMFKAILVCSSLMFSVLIYNGYENAIGYPAAATPPQYFMFLYAVVDEPAPIRHDPGAIYIWLFDKSGRPEPRALKLPYSKQDRDTVNMALDKIRKGERVFMGTPGTDKGKGDAKLTGNDQKKGGTGNSTIPYNTTHRQLDFKAPPDTMPKKGHDNSG